MHDLEPGGELDGFAGTVAIFPLPDLVLFPGTLLPLHIFEPRYRQMVRDALDGNRLIAMVKLRCGWERSPLCPPVHGVACLGKIVEVFQHPDGRFHLVLCGARRARLLGFEATDKPYRVARVELIEDRPAGADAPGAGPRGDAAGRRLLDLVAAMPARALRHKNLGLALRKLDAPLGLLTDLVADSLRVECAFKQRLLEDPDPLARARALCDRLGAESALDRGQVLAPTATAPAEPSLN
jgi:Lon protease-like protein